MTTVEASSVRPRLTLGVASAGTFLVLVAFTSTVTTVIPTAQALHAGASGRTWILSSISLGLAVALLALGEIADSRGRRRVFVASTVGVAVTSVAGGLAPSLDFLVGARILEGIACAGVLASGLGLIGGAFPTGPARTHATGLWGATIGAGIAAGPAASAGLADLAGWRTIYWVVAAGAALLVGLARLMGESRRDSARRLDVAGVLVFAAAMACVTAGLTLGRQSWTQLGTVATLAASVLLLAAFIAVELRVADPVLQPRLFTRPLFIASATGALFTGLALIALMSFLPLMTQEALGSTALGSAGILALWSVPSMVVATQVRRLPPRLGSAPRLSIGFVLCGIGVAALSGLSAHTTWIRLTPGLLVAGIGSGLINAALGRLAVESVPLEHAAMGSGANNTARYLGGAAGIALVFALVATGSSAPGAVGLVRGWNLAASVAFVLCLVAAVVAAGCELLRRPRPPATAVIGTPSPFLRLEERR